MIGILVILVSLLLASCAPILNEVKETRELMGTYVTITVYHEDLNVAENAIDNAFAKIEKTESILSTYLNDSEIFELNSKKEVDNVSDELLENVKAAVKYGNLSNGSFDVTVQPVLDLYKESFEEKQQPPSDEEIREVLKKVDYKKIKVSGNMISLSDEQKITLGGLAKGYAVDRSIEELKKNGIEHALVNAGGDMKALGKKAGNTDWTIALANPRDKEDYITIVKLSDKAIVTSGDYERYFDEDKDFHHIVNPKTGYSATELISVTVIGDSALDADALATSIFVMGRNGIELVESIEGIEALLITKNKEIVRSSGFNEVN